jgi:Uma2 family endonuclease
MFPKDELAYRLRRAIEASGSSLFVGTEGSVALSDVDLPLPDILLTYEPRGPGPVPGASVRLLVEIADTSLDHDVSRKARLYASRGVAEYWVLDVNAGVIHQMWSPQGEAYRERREVKLGERIKSATIEGLAVETGGIG